jgi:hypothetical protein
MGFYFRKSFKLGPVRFNLSKSGVGLSAGVKGARVGVDAKGKKYIHVGRSGIYYRQTLDDSPEAVADEADSQGSGVGWGTVLIILAILLILYWIANL